MIVSFRDGLERSRFINKVLGVVTACLLALNFTQGFLNFTLYDDFKSVVDSKIENTVIKLVPIRSRGPITVSLNDEIPPQYIKEATIDVVELHENWSWLNINDNYDEIMKIHSSVHYENFLQANLASTNIIENVKKRHSLSSIKIDRGKSRAFYCSKIGMACSVIHGKRTVYIDYNKPVEEREVSYFVLSKIVMPSESKPSPLHIERLVVLDTGNETLQRALDMLERAKNGEVPKS